MPLFKLEIPIGAVRGATEYADGGRWRDMSLVRFYNNVMQPVGGWRKRISNQMSGMGRAIKTWRDNNGNKWIAVGSNTNLYAISGGGDFYDITPAAFITGSADAQGAIGYGIGAYGEYSYGTARPESAQSGVVTASTWSLDNWGEDLVGVMADDGRLFQWPLTVSAPVAATVIPNAPTAVAGVVVSEERIMFAYGSNGLTGDDRLIQWSDQENNQSWTPSTTNQAGSQILQSSGRIVGACRVVNGTLFLTDTDVHLASYVGAPFVYRFDRQATNAGLIAQNAVIQVEGSAMWMGSGTFWTFDGSVKALPCSVAEYVYGDMNVSQQSKIVASSNTKFSEVTWFYPSENSVEVDRYVTYSYRTGAWTTGYLARTASSDGGVFGAPIMVSTDGYLYDHEVGLDYDGQEVFAETGPIEIGIGDNLAVVTNLIPDVSNLGDVQLEFKTQLYPNATETTHGPYSLTQPTSLRFTGRQIKMKIIGGSTDWRVGNNRVEVKAGGKR
jgi:hypothetical protein